ncbi:sigma factor-like helix-turn-helix DNA-binding protein [Aquihabitans daechungensis]|uniref:sigma factor-like helix-turn-helix DNA-binding protein n=1 Tax=Aquihabitans daechungensis TaxID=1052257 RepID=UPI003BA350A9
MSGGTSELRRRLAAYPQPVARAAGAVARARTAPEQIDAVLKAAEVLARYAAVTVLSSFACRNGAKPDEDLLPRFRGNLSFGQFIAVAQCIARRTEDHPLAQFATTRFAASSGRGPAEAPLVALLEMRNDLGHALAHLDATRARRIEREADPVGLFIAALDACSPLLDLPLLIVEQQILDRGAVTARCLHLVGESPPFPEEIGLTAGVHFASRPYLAVFEGLLSLSPGMIWEPIQGVEDICVIEAVNDGSVIFRSSRDSSRVKDTELYADVGPWREGAAGSLEPVGLSASISVFQHLTGIEPPDREPILAIEPGLAAPIVEADWAQIAGFAGSSGRALLKPLRDLTIDAAFDGTSSHLAVVGSRIEWRFDRGLTLSATVVDGALEIRVLGVDHAGVALVRAREPLTAAIDVLAAWLADPPMALTGAEPEVVGPEPTPIPPEVIEPGDGALDRELVLDRIVDQDVSTASLARELGCSERALKRQLEDVGLSSLLVTKVTHVGLPVEVIDDYQAGLSTRDLAREHGVRVSVLARWLVRVGVELRAEDLALAGGRQPKYLRSFLEQAWVEDRRTLQDIGDEMGLTRERVRQLVERYLLTRGPGPDPAEQLPEPMLRHMYEVQNLGPQEIAKRTGVPVRAVVELIDRWGLARLRVHERLGLTKPLLEEMYITRRMSVLAIAAELDVPRQAVSAALSYHGIPLRSRREAISRGLDQVLTPEYLERRMAEGATVSDLAEEHETTVTTVNAYLGRAGLRPARVPDPRYDDILSEEVLRTEYEDSTLTLAEFAAQAGAPESEVRLRVRELGIVVPPRRNSQLDGLPDARSVAQAAAAGRPADLPLSDDELRSRYVDIGMSTEAIAAELGVSTSDVVRALCAAGVEVRLGIADRLAPALLRRRYVDEEATTVDLAREAGTTSATVTKYLKRAGIEVRGRSGRSRSHATELEEDMLQREYVDAGRSADSIAKEHGTNAAHVLSEVRRHGLPVRAVAGGSQKKAELQRALTPTYLRAQLVDQRRTLDDLAEEHGTSVRTITRYVERSGIELPNDVPAFVALKKPRRGASGSATAVIEAYGLLHDGAPLRLDVDRVPARWRSAVQTWVAANPSGADATWVTEINEGNLRWTFDRAVSSPNGVMQWIVESAGEEFGPCQATRIWCTADGTTLVALAGSAQSPKPHKEAADAHQPDDGDTL